MKHFNTDLLRDYQFGLVDTSETATVAAHLEACPECRAELEKITRQFAALDVLQDQPEVSEELLKSVLKKSHPFRKIIPFRTAAILAAAASITIILGVLQSGTKTGRDGSPSRPPVAQSTDRSARTLMSPFESRDVLTEPEPSLAELRAEQPFAPASNIELNVLPRRDDVQLTIYNAEDLTLVRETRMLTLKRGWNWLQFMWSNTLIDPTSLELEPKSYADQIEITQLVYPPRLNELARWTIFSETNGVADFELTYFTSGLKWNAFYEATLSPDEQTMQLAAYVRVDNASGEDYEEAQTRLVVGEIDLEDKIAELAKRQYAYDSPHRFKYGINRGLGFDVVDQRDLGMPQASSSSIVAFSFADLEQKEIIKQALSEYQLYTIEGRETIPDGWGKRLPSFDAQAIGVTNLYKYDEERWGRNTMRFLSFANTETSELGDTPLPDGRVRVFRHVDAASRRAGNRDPLETAHYVQESNPHPSLTPEEAGCLAYIGAADIKYIPVGEQVELELGAAQKVTVEPKLMRTRTENHEFNNDRQVSGFDEITDWKIEITNTRDLPVVVEIMRWTGDSFMGGLAGSSPDMYRLYENELPPQWKLESNTPYEKYDISHFRFTAQLVPGSKQEIHYELTMHHGSRREQNNQLEEE